MNPYSSLCDDFGVYVYVNTKMDLPTGRETILHFFDRVRKTYPTMTDFDHREIIGTQRLYLNQGTTASRDLSVAILAGSCVGGGTAINWQTSLRAPDYIRDEWAERENSSRAELSDRRLYLPVK